MWLPCNFGEKIKLRKGMGRDLEEAELVGLQLDIAYIAGAKYCYVFRMSNGEPHFMQLKNGLSYWPHAFNNKDAYDETTLHEGDIALSIYPCDMFHQLNKHFFNVKSRAECRCTSVIRHKDGWHYNFTGRDGIGKIIVAPELLIREPFRAYADDPLLQ